MKVTCKSQRGDIVKVRHPRLGNQQTACVMWVSPTKGTVEVLFADNTRGYEFPEHDGVWVQSEKSKNWKPGSVIAFKGMVNEAKELSA